MTITPVEFDYIRELVQHETAIVLGQDKAYLVNLRLGGLATKEGFNSSKDLIQHLVRTSDQGLTKKVAEAMTTNETLFFRDHRPFELLKNKLLPEMLEKRGTDKCLNIWSAACSTGQEPYSLALLLHHHFQAWISKGWRFHIYATDLSGDCLAYARRALYTQFEVNRGLPASYLVRYFEQEGKQWQLKPEIQRYVRFQELNLMEPWVDLPKMDVVLLRNVLIYFHVDVKKQILTRVKHKLRSDGVLLLGGSETTLQLDSSFQRHDALKAAYYTV